MNEIYIGVDGSMGSRAALSWAAAEAALHEVPLNVVHVYERHVSWMSLSEHRYSSPQYMKELRDNLERVESAAERHAQSLLETMTRGLTGIEVRSKAVESNHPAEKLVELSRDAEMLVLGSRGRGSFASLLLGSISQQCAQHAECPVVIIPTSKSTVEAQSQEADPDLEVDPDRDLDPGLD